MLCWLPRSRPFLPCAWAVALSFPTVARAQIGDSTGLVTIRVRSAEAPLADVDLRAGSARALTDATGQASLRLRAGPRLIIARKIGFRPDTLSVVVRAGADTTLGLSLAEAVAELAAITVAAARGTRHVEDEPMRVEVLAGPDIAEKTQMRPQDLTNFMAEISGVRIQPTSPGLGGAAIRILGMRGQYTQILSDGLPLSGSMPGGLLLAQGAPVDLAQVEVIKGAATALYGPGALGGVVNLVSRRPDNLTDLLVAARAPAGGDAFLWTAPQLSERAGLTVLGDAHGQAAQDRDGDGWTDGPGYARVGLRPRVFWTGTSGASLLATVGGMAENRRGGTIAGRTAPDGQPFTTGVDTRRVDGGVISDLPARGSAVFHVRAAATYARQDARYGNVIERGRTTTLFGEATLSLGRGPLDGVVGVAFQHNRDRNADVPRHDYDYTTTSLFGQATWSPAHAFATTLAARCDDHSRYGAFCSPRLSLLYHLDKEWSVRLSGGTGFFAPTPFTEESEPIGLTPIAPLAVSAERGRDASLDVAGEVGKVEITATLFVSELTRPVTLASTPAGSAYPREFVNAPGPTRTGGGEVFAVYDVRPIVITASYAYLWASEVEPLSGVRHDTPRNPRHNVFVDLGWGGLNATWIALEVNWIGPQALTDDPALTRSPAFVDVALVASRTVGPLTGYVNADNLTNVRQTRYEPLLRSSRAPGEAWTVGQWAPVEGRLISAGMRYRF